MSAVIDERVGRKVPLSSPSQSARDFAKLLNELERDRSLLKLLSENCKERQKELSWEKRLRLWWSGIRRFSKIIPSFFTIKKGFFRKPTRPSLPLRKAPPLFSSPFPLRGQGM